MVDKSLAYAHVVVRTNKAHIESSGDRLQRARERLRQSVTRSTPRPPGDAADTPPFHCPTCNDVLALHISRTEADETNLPIMTQVYLCQKHGFFHCTEGADFSTGI